MRVILALLFTVFPWTPMAPARAGPLTGTEIASTLAFAEQQALKTIAFLGDDPTRYPRSRVAGGGGWGLVVSAADWTAGFWPWELTSLYRAAGDPFWLNKAIAWTAPLAARAVGGDADTGMKMQSQGALYALTGDPAYKAVLAQAAGTLAGRFNATVGAVDQWDFTGANTFDLVIDGMNNLRPLMWSGANGGDPAWLTEAEQHARTVAATLIRADGSTFQYAVFNPVTGARTFLGTYQGAGDNSDWQRGLTWAINGYADLYHQSGDSLFLSIAQSLADHFIAALPADCVPYWDVLAPNAPNIPRDTSAAALGDLGLTKLSVLATSASDRDRYAASAQCGLHSLIANGYLAPGTASAVLRHGNAPDGVDVPLIYGDAAFVTALVAQQNLNDGLPITWTMSYDYAPLIAADLMEPGAVLVLLPGVIVLMGLRRRA